MHQCLYILDKLTDYCVVPFAWCSDEVALVLLSFFVSVIVLAIFKRISNQENIQYHKNIIFGYILETGIFRDQIGRILVNQFNILKHNLVYLRYVATPFLILMLPIVFICIELDSRLGFQPFQNEQAFIIQATFSEESILNSPEIVNTIRCESSDGITIETPPLRIPSEGSVFWRARVTNPAENSSVRLLVDHSPGIIEKSVQTGSSNHQILPTISRSDTWTSFLFFYEKPMNKDYAIQTVKINYKRKDISLLSVKLPAVIWFFILTIVFGFIVKPFLRVSF